MICPECEGPGTITSLVFGTYHDRVCPTCRGKGEVPGREPTYRESLDTVVARVVKEHEPALLYLSDK